MNFREVRAKVPSEYGLVMGNTIPKDTNLLQGLEKVIAVLGHGDGTKLDIARNIPY